MSTEQQQHRFYVRDTDLEVVKRWWAAHDVPVDLDLVLPDDGIIIPDLCAAWIYFSSNSDFAWIAWMVGNPERSPREVFRGLQLVIEELKDYAKYCDAKAVTIFTEVSGLVKLFKKIGFQESPSKMTQLFSGL